MSNFKNKFVAASTLTALTATIIQPAIVEAEGDFFSDVKEGQSFYKFVKALWEDNVISGYPDNTYRPYHTLTRTEAAILFVRSLKLDVPNHAETWLNSYEDVTMNSKAAPYIASLRSKGILLAEDEFNGEEELSREEMASWLVRAFDLKAIDGVEVPFTDLAQVTDQHVANVEVLYQNEITSGKGDGSYAPHEAVNRGEFAIFLYRALHSKVISKVQTFDDLSINEGDHLVLPNKAFVQYNNEDIEQLDIEWNVDEIPYHIPGNYTLIGKLNGTSKKLTINLEVKVIPLSVDRVDSLSMKQIRVIFNHDRYNSEDISNSNNYQVTNTLGEPIKIHNVNVDQNQVLITIDNEEYVSLSLTVLPPLLQEKSSTNLVISDTIQPSVGHIQILDKNKLEVSFSEPINFEVEDGVIITNREIISRFQLSDTNYAVKTLQVNDYGTSVIMELSEDLEEGDTHTLIIKDQIVDFFGNKVINSEFPFEISFDSTPPKSLGVKEVYPSRATVTFNKPIHLRTDLVNITRYFHHTDRSIVAKEVRVINEKDLLIAFESDDQLPTTGKIIIDKNVLIDSFGNKNGVVIEESFDRLSDLTGPTLTNTYMVKQGETSSNYVQLKVHLTEPVSNKDLTMNLFEVKNSQGQPIPIRHVELRKTENNYYNDRIVTLTLDTYYGNLPNDTYTLAIQDVVDLNGNYGSDSVVFQAGSESKPKDFSGFALKGNDNYVFIINFGREMTVTANEPYTINDLSKYELVVNSENALLEQLDALKGVDVDLNMYEDGHKAEIIVKKVTALDGKWEQFFNHLDTAIEYENTSNVQLMVGRVADSKGNKTDSFSNNVMLDIQSGFTIAEDTVHAVSKDRIEIKFNDIILKIDEKDFYLYQDKDHNGSFSASEVLDASVDLIEENGTSKVIITPAKSINNNGKIENDNLYITSLPDRDTYNRFGQKLDFINVRVKDKILPTLATNGYGDQVYALSSSNGTAILNLLFSENIDASTVTRLSFTVGDGKYKVNSAQVDGSRVKLYIDLERAKIQDLKGVRIKQTAPISDLNNNIVTDIQTIVTGTY